MLSPFSVFSILFRTRDNVLCLLFTGKLAIMILNHIAEDFLNGFESYHNVYMVYDNNVHSESLEERRTD